MQLNKGYTQVSTHLSCAISLLAHDVQGGSNADNILADGFLKGLSTGIDVSHFEMDPLCRRKC